MRVWAAIATALETRGAAALVTVVASRGSAPRDAGTRMVVHPNGTFTGTIGGGTLEWRAIAEAQAMSAAIAPASPAPAAASPVPASRFRLLPFALGPELGQCCGGHVRLAVEVFDRSRAGEVAALAAREAVGPFATRGRIDEAGIRREIVEAAGDSTGAAGHGPAAAVDGDVLAERFGESPRTLLLFGAGHVGRALVLALAPLPFRVIWVDPRPEAFPQAVPGNVSLVRPVDPVAMLRRAPDGAFVLATTHSHALDLAVVDGALAEARFSYVGVIGSATKRARFESRLAALGHSAEAIGGLVCPIGATGPTSKLPAVIAAATAVELIVRDEAERAGVAPVRAAAAVGAGTDAGRAGETAPKLAAGGGRGA